jgi:hypothetical protein
MAQADRCVTPRFIEPRFIEKIDVKFARGATVLAAGLLMSVLAFSTADAQQYRGTQDQQQACTPDVMRLCNDSVPDVDRIVACLRRNRSGLSPACGAVFGAGTSHRPRHQKS